MSYKGALKLADVINYEGEGGVKVFLIALGVGVSQADAFADRLWEKLYPKIYPSEQKSDSSVHDESLIFYSRLFDR